MPNLLQSTGNRRISKVMFVTTLAERLSLALSQKGLSQADLARKAFVSRATVSQWCSGDIHTMNSANADRVARVLGVNRQWLETGRDTPAIPAVDEQGTLESRLLMAFSLLLENQKIPAIEYIENIARENAQMYKELLEKYGTAVPDEVVAKFLPMPPA